jgi:hypothetical protein
MANDYYVYVHRRKTDGRVFYVGKGKGNRANSRSGRSAYWKNIVAKHGLLIELVQYGMLEADAFILERELIASYGRGTLCNLTDGGDGASGSIKSPEARRKIGQSKLGRPRPDISGPNGIMLRPGVAEKVRESRKHLSYEWSKGKNNPAANPVVAAKISASLKGKPKSEDHRANLSKAQKGKECPWISGELNPTARSVLCVTTGQHFKTIKDAAVWANTNMPTKWSGDTHKKKRAEALFLIYNSVHHTESAIDIAKGR